jgi:hypothetical protein
MSNPAIAIRLALIGLATLILTVGSYRLGASHVQAQWDTERAKLAANKAETETRQAEATTRVVTQYVDRVQTVRERGKTIVQQVPTYVPNDSAACDLPAGFRVLHDAAAAGELPDPAANADAAGVPAQTVAATVADNYARHHEIVEQLGALQQWVREQQAASAVQQETD